MAMELIETIEVGAGGAASIEFTSIPQDGVDLLCLLSGRDTSGLYSATAYPLFNGTNPSGGKELIGDGSNVYTSSIDRIRLPASGSTANTFGSINIYISNYTNSNFSWSIDCVTENNGTSADQSIVTQTATNGPLTALELDANFVQYSTASLYKIY